MTAAMITRGEAALAVVDMQERLMAAFPEDRRASVTRNALILIETARTFGLPLVVSEQYPKGLGPTAAVVREALGEGVTPVQKMVFSCGRSPEFAAALAATGRRDVIITGVETHVCVLQTAVDLLQAGYRVFVAADAVTSRRELDWTTGLAFMKEAGATIATTEMLVFQLLERADTDEFKKIARLLK